MKDIIKVIIPKRARLWLRYQGFKWRAWRYKGDVVSCNVCQKTFSQMLPKANRKGAVCPYCNSLERQRFLVYYIEHVVLKMKVLEKVLYFSPLPALQKRLQRIPKILHVTSGDIDPVMADELIDITANPYSDQYFDLVICSHVLAHIPNELLAISELYRVTKKGGALLIFTNYEVGHLNTVDLSTEHTQTSFNIESDTLRIHGKDLAKRLETAGFKVELVKASDIVSKSDMLKYAFRDEDILFHCVNA